MEQTITCPICGQTYSSALCPKCGFENRLMLVSEPNPIIQQIDEQRIEIAKRNWDFAIKLQEEIESLTKENQNAQSKNTELNQTIAELDSQIKKLCTVDDENKRLRRDLVEQQEKMDAVTIERDKMLNEKSQLNKKQKELEDRMNDLSAHLSSAQYEISQLNSRLEEKQKQIFQAENTISDLTQQRDDYKEQLSRMTKEKDVVDTQYRKLFEQMSSMQYEVSQLKDKVKSHQDNELVGIVSVKNNKSEALQYLPVYKGVNTYGAASGDWGNHHEIKVRVRGGGLRPKHFSVTIEKQAIIKPVDNAELMYYGIPVPAQGIAVVAQQGIIISDILELHISKI